MAAPLPSVFVISLPGETKRRAGMTEKLGRLAIPFTFFDAVDGRAMDLATRADYDGKRRRSTSGKDLTGGEMGCLLSHKAVFEKIISDNLPAALILEDDAVLAPEFPAVLQATQNTSLSYDVIRFLGSPKVARGRHRKIIPLTKDYWLVRLRNVHGGAHAYLITNAGARRMLSFMQRNAFPIDTLLGRTWETGAEVLSVQPGLATQDLSFDSAIGEIRHDKQFKKKLSFALTRGAYKINEALGKRWVYWSRLPRDSQQKRRFSKS